jgi:hypothetical protein
MSLPHGWIDPAGHIHEVDIDHAEIDVGGPWPEAFARGWIRIGEAFGVSFAHGTREAIYHNRDLLAMLMGPGEKIRLQYHPGMVGDLWTREQLLGMDAPEIESDVREQMRERLLRGETGGIRGYRYRRPVRRHARSLK